MASIFGTSNPNQNLSTIDTPEFAGLTINGDEVITEAGNQNLDITLTTSQIAFLNNNELVTKYYVDTTSGVGTYQLVYNADVASPQIQLTTAKNINFIDTVSGNALTILANGDGVSTKKIISDILIKTGGLSTQFLKADGTVDNNVYLTAASSTINDLITKTQNIDLSTNAGNTFINGNIITYQPDISNIGTSSFRFNGYFNNMNYKGLSTYLPNSRTSGNILPNLTLTDNLGSSLLRYNEIYSGETNTNLLTVNTSLTCPLIIGNTTFSGNITSPSIIKTGGLSTQFLKADGSIDSNTYLTAASSTINDLTTKTQNIDLSTSSGNTYLYGNIITYDPDIANIGTSSFRFNGYFNNMNYKGLSTYLPNSRTSGNILPNLTLTDTLGSSLLRYNEIYSGATNTNLLTVNTSLTCPLIIGNTIFSGSITATNYTKTGGLSTEFLKANGTISNIFNSSIDLLSSSTIYTLNTLNFRWNGATSQPQIMRTGTNLGYSYSITFFKPGILAPIYLTGTVLLVNNIWSYFTNSGSIDINYTAILNGGRYEITFINTNVNITSFRISLYYSAFNFRAGLQIYAI